LRYSENQDDHYEHKERTTNAYRKSHGLRGADFVDYAELAGAKYGVIALTW
jgi:hypothetical protein